MSNLKYEYKKDLTFYGILNLIIYVVFSFLLLPILGNFRKIERIHYIVWYGMVLIQSIYMIYIIYNINKYKNDMMSRTIYKFFTTGGFISYKDIFLTMELQPLFEYIVLFMIILLPIFKKNTFKEKVLFVFVKIGIFHVISSLMLMNWKDFTVDYNRKI